MRQRRRQTLRWTTAPLIMLASGLIACGPVMYFTPVQPPQGFIYTEVKAPLILPDPAQGHGETEEIEVYTEHVRIPFNILALLDFAWGQAAVDRALERSGMDRVYFADYTFVTVMGVYSKLSIHVHGVRG